MMMRKLLILAILTGLTMSSRAQLVVDNTSFNPTQLVQNVLVGGGVTVTNVTFNGMPANTVNGQVGLFNGLSSNIGLGSGMILATGNAQVAVGPNNQGGASQGPPQGTMGTDPDLQAITPNQIYDQAVLEFDFVPIGDSISFRYVFASEEYNEYVCANVNDAFGFFISGPGITGPYTNNAANIALIPGTNTPVSINTVNLGVAGTSGTASTCAAIDPAWASYNVYYAGTNNQNSVQYDGWTVVLTARAAVQCGETYHIKLAIADAGDGVWDSGVFLEAGSLSSSGVTISATTMTGDSTMVEGCGAAIFTFGRSDTTSSFTVNFQIGGTAQPGVDYTAIPDSVVIPQGQFSTSFIVDAFFDGITEPTETITLFITYDNGCGPDTVQATIYINNVDPLEVTATGTTNICTPDEFSILLANATGGYGPLSFVWDNSAGTGDSVVVVPLESTTYTITVTDTCGNVATNTVTVDILCDITVPNVFSPNGDGFNDVFYLINLDDYPNTHVQIYNRWGTIVYESTNYQNNWNGGDVPDGVYFYIITTQDPDQGPFNGTVTILRH
jgi:gliding motility-associated-like protein